MKWQPLLFAVVVLMLANNASAATVTQFNDSVLSKNFSTQTTQNFTVAITVPINSTMNSGWFGSVRGTPFEVISTQDAYVLNISAFKDAVRGGSGEPLKISYASDQTMRRSYVGFYNYNINLSTYPEVLLVLPYNSPGTDGQGDFNVTAYEIFGNASWSETTLTWNNQPCGSDYTPNGTFCNSTPIDKFPVHLIDNHVYNCTSDRIVLNVTNAFKGRSGNVSFMLVSDHNSSFNGVPDQVQMCSKETGANLPRNDTWPTQPSLYVGQYFNPSNITVFINNTIANQSVGILNSSFRYNLTLNVSQATNLSKSGLMQIPLTIQVGGPGVVEVSSIAFTYGIGGGHAILSFNDTSPYVVSWSQGSATFIKKFLVNNTGTLTAQNCSFLTTVTNDNDIAPYFQYSPLFSVVNASGLEINLSIVSPIDGNYNNNVNVQCVGTYPNDTYSTLTPVQFSFSISSPSASSGGGGGGSFSVTNVVNESIKLNPRLADLYFISNPTGNGEFSFTTYSNVELKTCEVPTGYECTISPEKTSATLRTSIPYQNAFSKTLNTQVILTGNAGQVGVVPVRIRVIYISIPTIAIAGLVLLGAAWVIKHKL